MLDDTTAIEMLHRRLDADDPALIATEAVLLRSAFEDIDDWLLWLDQHTVSTHAGDPATPNVLAIIRGVRRKIARQLDHVDLALAQVEP